MARNDDKRTQNEEEHSDFYEVMPYAHGLPYSDWADPRAEEDLAPDRDFADIDDEGKDIAIKTLVFVGLATLAISVLLIWAVQSVSTTFPVR